MRNLVKRIPGLRELAILLSNCLSGPFQGSESYWEKRYARGGNSGAGSYYHLMEFKASFLNAFVQEKTIQTVIEYGCGDGNQLRLASYSNYVGFDVSPTAIALCKRIFQYDKPKSFRLMKDYGGEMAELTLSLDVIYHLIEDKIFDSYMKILFSSSKRFVIIYSTNSEELNKVRARHVRHRNFTRWIEDNLNDWRMIRYMPNEYPFMGNESQGSLANFYVYEKVSTSALTR